jgi:transposase-like protein
MTESFRRNHSAAFKAIMALIALKEGQMLAQLAERFDVGPNEITMWKNQLRENPATYLREVSTGLPRSVIRHTRSDSACRVRLAAESPHCDAPRSTWHCP